MSKRPSMYAVFASIVENLAKRSTCSTRAAVGALLFDDNNMIYGTGYNGSPRGMPHCDDVGCDLDADGHCKNVVHAEVNAIVQCARIGRSTDGLSLFCTHSPCSRCATMIVQAGIKNVIFIHEYKSDIKSTRALLGRAGIGITAYDEEYEGVNELLREILQDDKAKRCEDQPARDEDARVV